jgi:hypothetical protein
LLEKELVTIVGRERAPGRPLLYGTTREFLRHFGLNEITDLPRPREIEEILGESQFETERRMLEAQAGAERMKEEEPEFKSRLPHIPKKKPELGSTVEIKSKDNLREIKTVERLKSLTKDDSPELLESDKSRNIDEQTIDAPPVQAKPESAVGSMLDLPSPGVFDEPTYETPVPNVDLAASREDESAEDSAEDTVEERTRQTEPPEGQVIAPVIAPIPDNTEVHAAQGSRVEEIHPELSENALESHATDNKSKWQTWKERVKGFIKKIFG